MTTQTEALKLALDFISRLKFADAEPEPERVMEAIKEALAQPDENKSALSLYESGFIDGREKGLKEAQPEQEPVAFLTNHRQRMNVQIKPEAFVWMPTTTDWEVPLYTAPPQRTWVGLTDEEIEDIELGCRSTPFGKIEAMRMVEAKLKEKNT